MKKILLSVLVLFSVLVLSVSKPYAQESCYNWYIVKRGNDCPGFPKECELVEKYGGLYVDKSSAKSGEKVIYLTFDTGYDNGNVSKIVSILNEKGVKASFFVLSNLIRKNGDLIKEMNNSGHLICNHTDNHKDMTKLTNEEFLSNLGRLEKLYYECTGEEMSKFFRFPEGHYDEEKLKCAYEAGYTTVFWSLAYADWDNGRQPANNRAMQILEDNCHNGAIILLHPTSATNVKILPLLIDKWKAEGYTFKTLDAIVK